MKEAIENCEGEIEGFFSVKNYFQVWGRVLFAAGILHRVCQFFSPQLRVLANVCRKFVACEIDAGRGGRKNSRSKARNGLDDTRNKKMGPFANPKGVRQGRLLCVHRCF
jgi:hypothetical protein